MTMYLEQLTSWNEFSVGTLYFTFAKSWHARNYSPWNWDSLGSLPRYSSTSLQKENNSALHGCFLYIVGMSTLPRMALYANILFLMFLKDISRASYSYHTPRREMLFSDPVILKSLLIQTAFKVICITKILRLQ